MEIKLNTFHVFIKLVGYIFCASFLIYKAGYSYERSTFTFLKTSYSEKNGLTQNSNKNTLMQRKCVYVCVCVCGLYKAYPYLNIKKKNFTLLLLSFENQLKYR